ncbi:universal stress protein [uncultured Cohaesibacter sp.]|uniref:universal stress protein n=1 Tax=uncultured Cohaesibacter sp. TaxID=1002546 RepID=UPI0029C84134|nr:universal stress protein [uncultured Cohaesibacter sp.]
MPQSGLTLSDLARTYDLIVTGHHSTDEDDEYLAAHPDLLALQSGRPVLVIPDGYEAPASTHHALVAWDGKRAAARALGDAIHILGNLHQVSVITIGNAGLIDPNPGGGVMALLKRHGIKSEYLHRAASGQSIASTLEEVAEEIEASLIVMGAFEHSKFSQDIFGGVTSEILKTSRIPVFMAH